VVDPDSPDALHPGYVTAYNLRQKLSKQLKIDLTSDETIHIVSTDPVHHSEINDTRLQSIVEDFTSSEKCEQKIKRLGEYIAKISLSGGHSVPLRFGVLQKVP